MNTAPLAESRMTRWLRSLPLAWMVLLLGQAPARALDPNVDPSLYPRDRWGTDQGLSQAYINDVTQTADGFLWIGTQSGLVRFDGLKFKIFDKGNTPELKVDFVQRLLPDPDGSLWIGTRGSGLLHMQGGSFSAIVLKDGLPDDTVMDLAHTKDGAVWISTLRSGICRLKNGRVEELPFDAGLPDTYAQRLLIDRDDRLWTARAAGQLFRQAPDPTVKPEWMAALPGQPSCLTMDRQGTVWATAKGGGEARSMVASFEGGWMTPRLQKALPTEDAPTKLFFDSNDQGWIALGNGGLMTFYKEHHHTISASALEADITCFFEDREGSVWAGTGGGGLLRFKNGRVAGIGPAQGLSATSSSQVAEDKEGRLWSFTQEWGLQEVLPDAKNGKMGGMVIRCGNPMVSAMTTSRQGGLWVGAGGGLLYRLPLNDQSEPPTFESSVALMLNENTPQNTIQSVFEMADGALWLCLSGGGLRRVETNGAITAYEEKDALPSLSIRTLIDAGGGALWLATQDAGVCLWRPGKARFFKGNEALERVRSLLLDERGVLWIGTRQNGLFRLEGESIRPCPIAPGSNPKAINSILEDGLGGLWLGGSGGIVTAPRAAFDQAAATGAPVVATLLNEGDGMPSSECRGGYNPGSLRDRNGVLWFSTARGLARVDPSWKVKRPAAVKPIIEELLVDGVPLPVDRPLTLKPGTSHLTIEYTLPALRSARKVRFATWLSGLEPGWSRETDSRSVNYGALGSGKYEFHLTAVNEDGERSPDDTVLAFQIEPFFYENRMLQVVTASILGVAAWLGVRLRHANLQARNNHLESVVRERTKVLRHEVAERKRAEAALHQLPQRILDAQETERRRVAGDLHDSVSQMLCGAKLRLQSLVRLAAADSSLKPLASETAQVVQQTIDEVRFISRNLRPADLDDFGLVIALEALCREVEHRSGMEVVWEPPSHQPNLDPNSELQLYRICQEALFNAEKHAAATRVVVSLTADDRHLVLSIRDNGKGLETKSGKPSPRSSGLGLHNMAERARVLEAGLFFDGGPGRGLELRLHAPIPPRQTRPQGQDPTFPSPPEAPETGADKRAARR